MDTRKLATYAATLSDTQLWRLFGRIADRSRMDEYGDYATYAACHPASWRALRTIDGEHKARIAAREGCN
jgi:hypothetical protein